jgi:hypothetical protein
MGRPFPGVFPYSVRARFTAVQSCASGGARGRPHQQGDRRPGVLAERGEMIPGQVLVRSRS